MLTIGLTGGIGSGKSAVAGFLVALGAPVIDADKVGHEIYQPGGPAYRAVLDAFSEAILAPDDTIDRRKLGSLVFASTAALAKLNAIVHPRMLARMHEMIAAMRADGERKPIVVEAAILIEANWQPLVDEIWLVNASKETVIERVERARGLQPYQIAARICAQLPESGRRKHATLIIENDGTLEELRAKVAQVWAQALARNH